MNAQEKGKKLATQFLHDHSTISRLKFIRQGRLLSLTYQTTERQESFFDGWMRYADEHHIFCPDRILANRIKRNLNAINRDLAHITRVAEKREFLRLPGEVEKIEKEAHVAWEDMRELGFGDQFLTIVENKAVMYEVPQIIVEKAHERYA